LGKIISEVQEKQAGKPNFVDDIETTFMLIATYLEIMVSRRKLEAVSAFFCSFVMI